jgi:hypothetical protein
MKYKFKQLSSEEIQTLQVDACARLLGHNGNYIVALNGELLKLLVEKNKADQTLIGIKNLILSKKAEIDTVKAQNSTCQGIIKAG